MRTLPVQSKRHREFVKKWVSKNSFKRFHGNALLEIMNRIVMAAEDLYGFKIPEGPFTYKKTPYTRDIIDSMNNPGPHKEVIIMRGAAMGPTIQPIDLIDNLMQNSDGDRTEGYYWVKTPATHGWEPAWWNMRDRVWHLHGERSDCVSDFIPTEIDERPIERRSQC